MLADLTVTAPVPRRRSLRMAVLCIAVAVAAALLFQAENTAVTLMVLAMAVGVVLPMGYRWFRGRLDWFETLHVFNGIYFLYFGLGALWTAAQPEICSYDPHTTHLVSLAAFYCLLGQAALLAGYFAPGQMGQSRSRPAEWPCGYMFLGTVGGLGLVGYIASALIERSFYLEPKLMVSLGPIAQLAPLFLFAWALGWLLFYTGRSTRGQRLVLFGSLLPAAVMILYLTVSDKSLIMTIGGIPVIARWYGRRKIPWGVLLVMLLILVFVVFPVYNTYRGTDKHADNATRLEATYRNLQTWGASRYVEWSINTFKFRMSLINSVIVVINDTGRWVPFAKGSTIFRPALIWVVPRYLWPDKPVLEPGRDFGRVFRVTDYWSRDTFIAQTIPGELYWNFHLPGIIVGMWLLGYAMSWLYRAYGERGGLDPMRCAMHVLILVQFAHFHGSFAGDVIILSRLILLLVALRWVGRRLRMVELRLDAAAPSEPARSGG